MALAGTLTGRNRDDPAAAGVFALLMYQLINKKTQSSQGQRSLQTEQPESEWRRRKIKHEEERKTKA